MNLKSLFLVLSIMAFSFSTQADDLIKPYKDNDKFFKQNASKREIKIMSINAHNLYDTKHDDGYFDYTYLPIDHPSKSEQCETITHGHYKKLCFNLDWTDDKLSQKIKQLGKIIKGHGSTPDILALQEIENESVIKRLAQHTGYEKYIVTELKNKRGVDLALLYKTKALKYVAFDKIKSPARSILRAHFKTKPSNDDLFVYVNHWIAQSAPTSYRAKTAKALHEDIDKVHEQYENASIVLVGDFNTSDEEAEEVFNEHLLNKDWENRLVEAHTLSREKYPQYSKYFPNGSYWRGKNNWQRFDRIFMSGNLVQSKSKLRADIKSYRLLYSTEITGEYKYRENKDDETSPEVLIRYPLKYNFLENPKYPLGFTDHLPATIILRN